MPQAEEKKFWSAYGKIYPYLERSTPYQKLLKTIEDLIHPKQGETWLDVGCGPGTVIKIIRKKAQGKLQKIIGIDFDETMLGHAAKRSESYDEVELQNINLSHKTPFVKEKFDGIVANLVLPYIPEYDGQKGKQALRQILKELKRILKPGGSLIWSTPIKNVNFFWVFWASLKDIFNLRHPENLYYGPAILRHALTIQKKGRQGIYTFLPEKELRLLMKEIGFKTLAIRRTFAGQALVIKAIKKA